MAHDVSTALKDLQAIFKWEDPKRIIECALVFCDATSHWVVFAVFIYPAQKTMTKIV